MGTLNMKLSDALKVHDNYKLSTFIEDKIAGGPKKTRIIVRNHDTGEVLADTSNKIIVSGSCLNACKAFGLEDPSLQIFPSYDGQMEMDSLPLDVADENESPIVCLFCVDDSGCGSMQKEVYNCSNKDRIKPMIDSSGQPIEPEQATGQMIMPFRYVDADNDLNEDLRKYYFGRKTFQNGKIGYFFKGFDTEPQLHIQLADGTQIVDNVFDITSEQVVDCFVETRLRITRLDFRDYFDQVLGWDKARISSVSMLFGSWVENTDGIKWYKDVRPYTKLNFPFQWLVDLTIAIDFDYQIYY